MKLVLTIVLFLVTVGVVVSIIHANRMNHLYKDAFYALRRSYETDLENGALSKKSEIDREMALCQPRQLDVDRALDSFRAAKMTPMKDLRFESLDECNITLKELRYYTAQFNVALDVHERSFSDE